METARPFLVRCGTPVTTAAHGAAAAGKTRIVATIREIGYVVPIVDEGGCTPVEPGQAPGAH